jgi:hypothetical protein
MLLPENDDRYPPKFRAAWEREFSLDIFSVDHLASLIDRIENPDKYLPPPGVRLPPFLDVEEWAKIGLHRFIDSLDHNSMRDARDKLRRAAAQSRRRYPRAETLVMLSYVYMVRAELKITKLDLWDVVDKRCEYLKIAPPDERTRPRVLKKLGLETLSKGRKPRKGRSTAT